VTGPLGSTIAGLESQHRFGVIGTTEDHHAVSTAM
jgi:hypothetical protein